MHIRGTDKGAGREVVGPSAFLPFAEGFLDAAASAGAPAAIFLATGDGRFRDEVATAWPQRVREAIYWQGSDADSAGAPLLHIPSARCRAQYGIQWCHVRL